MTESRRRFRVAGTHRASPTGIWYDPMITPEPKLAPSYKREVALAEQRYVASIRVRNTRDEQPRKRQLGDMSQLSITERHSPEAHKEGRISPTNPLGAPHESFRPARSPTRTSVGQKKSPTSKTHLNIDGVKQGRTKTTPKSTPKSTPKISPKSAKAASKGTGKSGGKAGKSKDLENRTLLTAAEVYAEVAALRARASEVEATADGVTTATLDRKLGAALVEKLKTKTLAEMVREWDKNGDGEISPIELRACVRNNLGIKANNKEIDEWFTKMDADGGGSLDMAELKVFLKALTDAWEQGKSEDVHLRREAETIRERADFVEVVARATATMEDACVELDQLIHHPAVEVQLGRLIRLKGMKASDVVTKWDKDGDGTISKEEFREQVLELGVQGEPSAIDDLFDRYDDDGGGELSLEELRPTLKALIESSSKSIQDIKDCEKKVAMLRVEAALKQQEEANRKAEDTAAARAEEEAAAQAEAQRAAEKEEAKRKAKEMREAKEAEKAKLQAEYDAKIAARREEKGTIPGAAPSPSFNAGQMWGKAGNMMKALNSLSA